MSPIARGASGTPGLLDLLRNPAAAADLPDAAWTRIVQQARHAGLLGRLAERLQTAGTTLQLPAAVAGHFDSALRLCRAQQAEIQREVRYLVLAMSELAVPVVLLKGAAYAMTGLPAASGRIFGDVDILVPKSSLPRVESQLAMHGWLGTHQDAYDQRYYREWMHELPPMQHVHRQTVLDVHHTILPETARLHPDPRKLLDRAQPLPGYAGMHVLAPEDMVLHSMTHLFMNDDMGFGLRDLSDLDLLLRHFGPQADFWDRLARRARDLDLERPLYHGLRQTRRLLATPVPDHALRATAGDAPGALQAWLMDAIWWRALRSPHPSARVRGTSLALFLLYLRGHWLRMPLPLLVRHLATKAWMRLDPPAQNATQPTP